MSEESKARLKAKGDALKAKLGIKPKKPDGNKMVEEQIANLHKAQARNKKLLEDTAPKPKAKAKVKSAIDLEEDSVPLAPSNEAILQITQMCDYVRNIDAKIAELTSELNQNNGHRAKLVEVDIPEAMKVAGIKSFTLEDGAVVSVDTENYASYTKENEAAVFAWLRKNGHEDLIKNVIAVQFGKGDDAKAEQLRKILESKKFQDWTQKESIHAGTFKAFVREQLAEGKKLPKQIAIFPKTVATIKDIKNGNLSKKTSSNSSKKASGSDLF